MSVNELGILSSPISILSGANHGGLISDDYLLLADQKQPDGLDREQQTPDGYISKQLDFRNLAKSIKTDFDMSDIEAKLRFMEKQLEVPSSLMVIKNKGHAQKYVISALSENKRANFDGASCYNFTESVKDILNKITLPKISALVSPWLMQISVRNEYGNSVVQAASQSLAQRTEEEMEDIYLPRSWVLNRIASTTESEKYATSSKLAYYLYRHIYENYLRNAKVVNQVGTDTTAAASQALMNSISSIAKVRLHSKYPANVMGNSDVSAASQKLANALCTQISSEFKRYDDVGPYLQRRHVATFLGDHTDWAASQKLIYGLCSIVDSYAQPPLPWQEGNVLYMTPNGYGKSQPIATFDAYVCESDEDKRKTKQEGLTLKHVFNTWQRGGFHTNPSKFYEMNPSEYGELQAGGLDLAAQCFGVDKNVLENGTEAEINAEVSKSILYSQFRDFYRGTNYDPRLLISLFVAPVFHVLSDYGTDYDQVHDIYMHNRWVIFSTEQISNVLPDLYGRTSGTWTSGTCLHHLSSPSGVLHTEAILTGSVRTLYDSKYGSVISSDYLTLYTWNIESHPYGSISLRALGDYGYAYWFYNNQISTIVQPLNCGDETYFFSQQSYSKYTFKVRLYARESNDDDYMGVIVGHVYNPEINSMSYLVAMRTPNYSNDGVLNCICHWGIFKAGIYSNTSPLVVGHIGCRLSDITSPLSIKRIQDLSVENSNLGHYVKSYILNNLNTEEVTRQYFSGQRWTYEDCSYKPWGNMGDGVLVKVQRDGNRISAWTTLFGEEPIDANLGHMITADFEDVTGENFFGFPKYLLKPYQDEARVGLFSHSQDQSKYEIKEFNVPVVIADTRTNQIIDFYNGTETVRPGVNALEYLGDGRFQHNLYTKKLWYVDNDEFVKVYQPNGTNLITEDSRDVQNQTGITMIAEEE